MEIFGPEAGGKTTLALHIVASAQRSASAAVTFCRLSQLRIMLLLA